MSTPPVNQLARRLMSGRGLAGKAALITGGSRGIGFAIAQRFALEGMSCILVGRNQGTLRGALDSLNSMRADADGATQREQQGLSTSPEARHSCVEGDVGLASFWEDFVKSGRNVDVLVNAAGVAQSRFLWRTDLDEIHHILKTNLEGTIYGSRYIVKKMIKDKTKGCIINISSLLAGKGGQGASVYAASKAGIISLSRALVTEVGSFGIRANVIVPGYIQTDMTKHMDEEHLAGSIPLGRLGYTDEVADAAAFLAKNEYANNCVLNLDGGLSAM